MIDSNNVITRDRKRLNDLDADTDDLEDYQGKWRNMYFFKRNMYFFKHGSVTKYGSTEFPSKEEAEKDIEDDLRVLECARRTFLGYCILDTTDGEYQFAPNELAHIMPIPVKS